MHPDHVLLGIELLGLVAFLCVGAYLSWGR